MNQEEGQQQLNLWEKLQIVLREYDTLRAQIIQLIQGKNTITNFGIAFIGVLMAIGASAFKDAPQLTYIIIAVIAPLVSIGTLALVIRDIEEIHRIGYYLRRLEIKIEKMISGKLFEPISPDQQVQISQDLIEIETSPSILLFWENWVQIKRLRSRNHHLDVIVYFYLFLGLSLALQVHSLVDRSVDVGLKFIVLIVILSLNMLVYFSLRNRLDSVEVPIVRRKGNREGKSFWEKSQHEILHENSSINKQEKEEKKL